MLTVPTGLRVIGPALLLTFALPVAAQQSRVEATSLLGEPLRAPALSPATRAANEQRLDEARRAYDRAPTDPDSIIWLGRRTAYLGRFRDAIAIYTKGIALHPADARFYRHRGHRYLTVRDLDRAIADFEKAATLVAGTPDEVEPDGLPNARGIPTSTLQANIRYHLGLAYYLKHDFDRALPWYRADVAARVNDDMLVASSHWLYMTLRRLGRGREAARVLEPIMADLDVIENQAYHRLLLMYKGLLPVDSLLPPPGGGDLGLQDVTVAYGVGNWHLYHGRRDEARRIFDRILASGQWPAFGYLAAEAEVAAWPK